MLVECRESCSDVDGEEEEEEEDDSIISGMMISVLKNVWWRRGVRGCDSIPGMVIGQIRNWANMIIL